MVTLKTDQTTDVAVNGLMGKWLRQGGGDFLIKGNTTGENFRITVRGRGLPPRVPGKGTFAVMQADRVNGTGVRLQFIDFIGGEKSGLLNSRIESPNPESQAT